MPLERNLPKKSVTAAAPAKSPPKPTSPLPLWSRPGYLVRRLHQIHSALFAEECKKFNLTPVQYGLLTVLRDRPGSDQVTLCKEVGIDRTNAASPRHSAWSCTIPTHQSANGGITCRTRLGYRDCTKPLGNRDPSNNVIAFRGKRSSALIA